MLLEFDFLAHKEHQEVAPLIEGPQIEEDFAGFSLGSNSAPPRPVRGYELGDGTLRQLLLVFLRLI